MDIPKWEVSNILPKFDITTTALKMTKEKK